MLQAVHSRTTIIRMCILALLQSISSFPFAQLNRQKIAEPRFRRPNPFQASEIPCTSRRVVRRRANKNKATRKEKSQSV